MIFLFNEFFTVWSLRLLSLFIGLEVVLNFLLRDASCLLGRGRRLPEEAAKGGHVGRRSAGDLARRKQIYFDNACTADSPCKHRLTRRAANPFGRSACGGRSAGASCLSVPCRRLSRAPPLSSACLLACLLLCSPGRSASRGDSPGLEPAAVCFAGSFTSSVFGVERSGNFFHLCPRHPGARPQFPLRLGPGQPPLLPACALGLCTPGRLSFRFRSLVLAHSVSRRGAAPSLCMEEVQGRSITSDVGKLITWERGDKEGKTEADERAKSARGGRAPRQT